VSLINKLGVLYARYGVYDKAEEAFQRALKTQEYGPSLVNIGNLLYIRNALTEAVRYYERALAKTPTDSAVLLNLAKINYELGKYDKTDTYYSQLRKEDAQMAERFSYLAAKGGTDTARASNADAMKEVMVWGE
jgi:tetratricopeptide (TPR) repeat protein